MTALLQKEIERREAAHRKAHAEHQAYGNGQPFDMFSAIAEHETAGMRKALELVSQHSGDSTA